jgi:hypothetical protein
MPKRDGLERNPRFADAVATIRDVVLRPEVLWILLLAAFLSRAGLVAANYLDLTNNSGTDTESYVLIARQLLDGEEGYFRLRTPGYPIFLALTGLDLRLALLVQGLLGFATCGLVYFGVRSQCGELAARLSLAFLAIDVTTITYGNLLLSETLFTCLLTVALLLGATSRSRGSAVSCGVVLAAAAYVRPVGLLLAWLWPLVMAVAWKRPRRGLLVFATTGLLLLPWFVWQKQHYGEFQFSEISRINLLLHNAAYVIADIEDRALEDVQGEFYQLRAVPWEDRAIAILLSHPFTYLKVVAQGVPITLLSPAWNAFRYMLPGLGQGLLFVAAALACVFWLWLPFCVFSISRPLGLLALTTAAYLILIPGPQGRARFRVPAAPALAIAAGIGLARKMENEAAGRGAGRETAVTRGPAK